MKMQHVTIHTKKYEESINFYQAICGMKIQNQFDGDMKITFLANAAGETCIELIENTHAKSAGDCISVGFHVEDVAEYHKVLEAKALKPTPIISPNPATKFFFVEDPNGLNIQFI